MKNAKTLSSLGLVVLAIIAIVYFFYPENPYSKVELNKGDRVVTEGWIEGLKAEGLVGALVPAGTLHVKSFHLRRNQNYQNSLWQKLGISRSRARNSMIVQAQNDSLYIVGSDLMRAWRWVNIKDSAQQEVLDSLRAKQ